MLDNNYDKYTKYKQKYLSLTNNNDQIQTGGVLSKFLYKTSGIEDLVNIINEGMDNQDGDIIVKEQLIEYIKHFAQNTFILKRTISKPIEYDARVDGKSIIMHLCIKGYYHTLSYLGDYLISINLGKILNLKDNIDGMQLTPFQYICSKYSEQNNIMVRYFFNIEHIMNSVDNSNCLILYIKSLFKHYNFGPDSRHDNITNQEYTGFSSIESKLTDLSIIHKYKRLPNLETNEIENVILLIDNLPKIAVVSQFNKESASVLVLEFRNIKIMKAINKKIGGKIRFKIKTS